MPGLDRGFRNPFQSLTKQSTGIVHTDEDTQQVMRTEKGSFDSASVIELNMLRRLNQDLKYVDGGDNGESVKKLRSFKACRQGKSGTKLPYSKNKMFVHLV